MIAVELRSPDSLHKLACEPAEEEGISMNQSITLAVAEKISVLKTERYLAARRTGRQCEVRGGASIGGRHRAAG